MDSYNSYNGFASVYDELMDQTPYEEWSQTVVDILKENNINDGLVLDLGCGTGTVTELLATAGYDMIGVDLSGEMLEEAMKKRDESGHDILYLCQDMREFELYGTVMAVVSLCDSINYLLDDEDVIETFRLVNNYLDPNGLFIFDINTDYKYREIIGDSVIAENRDDCSFIWENEYDEESGINAYYLTLFIKNGEGLFEKVEEEHYQKGYSIEKIKGFIEKAGMIFEKAFDTDTKGQVTDTTQRFTVVAREKGKAYE